MTKESRRNLYLGGALLLALAEVGLIVSGNGGQQASGVTLFLAFYLLSYSVKYTKTLSGLSFTLQIFAFVAFTLYFPGLFTNWGFDTTILIVPSVQIIMFGMGTKLSIGDFAREFKKPLKIVVGVILIYTAMPLAALLIITLHPFPPEIAAGIILLGACPTGAASNVLTYLAGGNLALALSITMLATLVSPVTTPLLMQTFAGKLIAVNAVGMMISILNMIFVPIGAGLICNKILYGKAAWMSRAGNLAALAVVCFACGLALIFVPFSPAIKSMQSGLVLVFWAVAVVAFTKMMVDRAHGPANWMELILPKLSLASIMFYIVIVAAHNKDTLMLIGPALFVATMMHNFLGFILGYATAKALRLNDRDVRAYTTTVGLKNAGVGVGLAYDVLHSQAAALASLIFGTWMNISGSTLANFWRQRPARD